MPILSITNILTKRNLTKTNYNYQLTSASVGKFSPHGLPLNSAPEFQRKSLIQPPLPSSVGKKENNGFLIPFIISKVNPGL